MKRASWMAALLGLAALLVCLSLPRESGAQGWWRTRTPTPTITPFPPGAEPLGIVPVIGTTYGMITTDTAEVRAGPDFAYASVGALPRDASVVVLGRAGDFYSQWDGRQWVQIQYGSTPAWVYARLIRTSTAFNSIFPTGMLLPRDANGRVPDGFDLSSDICSQWQGEFTLSGDFMAGGDRLTVTYPLLQGANVYSVIVIAPDGTRRAFDSTTNTSQIHIGLLPQQGGTYTWRVAPYWTNAPQRYYWQQVCLLRTGGTFEKPDTSPPR